MVLFGTLEVCLTKRVVVQNSLLIIWHTQIPITDSFVSSAVVFDCVRFY